MKNYNWRKCVLNSDSRDVIKRIPDNSIDLILTDPPYNLGQHSTGNIPLPGRSAMNNDVAEWDMIDFNPEEWADEFVRILKPTGNLFIFTSYNQIGRWYSCLDHKFDTSNFMIWHKTNPAPKIFKAGFLNSCEMIFTCWNKKHTWNFISQAEMHNFIETPICMQPERLREPKHPAQKPVSVLKKVIKIASNENDIVFDPFMGVGSVGVAALYLNRKYIGVEIDEKYFVAAKKRIDECLHLNEYDSCMKEIRYASIDERENEMNLSEPAVDYDEEFTIEDVFQKRSTHLVPLTLAPIIKWPGGKEKELKFILPNLPIFKRYFEPFVGGGSVFMAINAKEYFINDFSSELISLYKSIGSLNSAFFDYSDKIVSSWKNSKSFFDTHKSTFVDMYVKYRNNAISKEELGILIKSFCQENECDIIHIIDTLFQKFPIVLKKELEVNMFRKMKRMKELELQKQLLPVADIYDNIETAIKSALYMNFRNLYNSRELYKNNEALRSSLFFFIRNYAYSGMFRYSKKGEFNVPYGGIAYNSKQLDRKLNYYRSEALQNHFRKARFFCHDFESFLVDNKPNSEDFIFLDPPYDTEFSTYAQNVFTKHDQERLASFLINKCESKWMLVIKYTDFIYNLYNKPGVNIRSFDKEYMVSFMNRNNKKVTHLLITNF